jgi:hypothetical protein
MKKLCLILTTTSVLLFGTIGCTNLVTARATDQPDYSSEEVGAIITQELKNIEPPITEIYYYNRYQWELTSHQIRDTRYIDDGKWEVSSQASFDGYHKGFSVGIESLTLNWHFYEKDGTVELIEKELLHPEGAPPTFSRTEVTAIMRDHISDIFYGDAKLNFHDTSHWKLKYLGDGKWEVRLVITNAVGVWHLYEDSETVEFLGRLGP